MMGKKILFIDDCPEDVPLSIELLEDAGYTVQLVRKSIEALQIISEKISEESKYYDLIVLDISLFGEKPNDNFNNTKAGFYLLEEIRKKCKSIPVIVSSMTKSFVDDALRLGANEVLKRRHSPGDLLKVIKKYI